MSEERLGRYILDRRIASGGMAEVFLARQSGPKGYERSCVIKRMLSHISDDEVFVHMFLDEARLAAQLTHPNVAQIYDFGEEAGVFFLAMEYVSGANLRDVIHHHHAHGTFVPFPLVARITADAARGLAYAHDAVGQDGQPLNIIHRDVSPHNILLSRNGVVKLIDFGIAKTAIATGKTGAGLIKGKYAYMSPEQVMGQPLDRRSDLYALGLVFYELLTNARAIGGNDAQVMMMAAAHPSFIPIGRLRPDTPPELLRVAERALAPNREQRYSSGEEMAADLDAYLRTQAAVTDTGLARLLPPLGETPRRFSSTSNPTRQETPHSKDVSITTPSPRNTTTTPLRPLREGPSVTSPDAPPQPSAQPVPQPPPGPPSGRFAKRRILMSVAAVSVVLGALGAALWWPSPASPPPEPVVVRAPLPAPPPSPPSPPAPTPVAVPEEPKVDVKPPPQLKPVVEPKPPETKHVAHAHDHHRMPPPVPERHEEQAMAPAAKGTVDIRALPYAEVFLGEKSLGVTPFKPLELPAGHYRFRLVNKSRSETREVEVEPGKQSVVRVDLREP